MGIVKIQLERGRSCLLKLRNVTKKFGHHVAVNNLNLDIPERELFGFLGGNGAGKTTTFRMILGLLDKTSGTITWRDEPITYQKSHLIGYLPEERGLYPKLKVEEQLVYFGKLRHMTVQQAKESIAKWLDRFQITHYKQKKVEELSKGNQQKIQFICAVLHKPQLLILDEPFSGLDPINVAMMKEAVVDLTKTNTSIVFSSHQMEHVEELCENICILREGNAVVQGNLAEIKRSYRKRNVFIEVDVDISFLEQMTGVVRFKQTAQGYEVQIAEEKVAHDLYRALVDYPVSTFTIEEPRLNDIFIEKVGESYE